MPATIPDCWSADVKTDVWTPLAILRVQAGLLAQKNQGILDAKVNAIASDEWVQHQLDPIAPALDQYRVSLLAAQHDKDCVYPVVVTSQAFVPKRAPESGTVRDALRACEFNHQAIRLIVRKPGDPMVRQVV